MCVDGAISFGASAAFDHQICSRQQMAAHFALNTTPVPSLSAAMQKPNAVDATMCTMAWADATRLIFTGTTTRRASAATRTPSVGLHAELALKSRAAPGSKHIDCTTTTGRTMLKGRMGDIPCDLDISLSVYHGGRITVIAQVYHPLSEADRPVCPATAHSKDAPLFDEDQL